MDPNKNEFLNLRASNGKFVIFSSDNRKAITWKKTLFPDFNSSYRKKLNFFFFALFALHWKSTFLLNVEFCKDAR